MNGAKKYMLVSLVPLAFASLFIFDSPWSSNRPNSASVDSLDYTIRRGNEYVEAKYTGIRNIQQQLKTPELSPEQLYRINEELYYIFKNFVCDSAFHYAEKKLKIAESLQKQTWIDESKLHLSSVFYVTGMYKEALDVLNSIVENKLDDRLKIAYYNNYKEVYAYYSSDNLFASRYGDMSKAYRDTLLSLLEPESNHYLIVYSEKLKDEGKLLESEKILSALLDESSSKNHEFAILNYAIAGVYRDRGNIDAAKKHLALSADADIRNAIKENAAIRELAVLMYETGDLTRAYRYIKCSLEDAVFCNARMRTVEISKIFPIVDTAYMEKTGKQKNQLKLYLFATVIVSLLLIIAVAYVYKQMKRLALIRNEIHEANRRLNELNEQLLQSNAQLKESNEIKDQYIIQSLYGKSEYIERFERLLKKIRAKTATKQYNDLDNLYKDFNVKIERENMFSSFDRTFLILFPNFIEEYNRLFAPTDHATTDENGNLTPELRIFALMRLGITENEHIARFLNIAIKTVYSYKSRAKAKTIIPKEDFERRITTIRRKE